MLLEIKGNPRKITIEETIEAMDWFLKHLCDQKADDLQVEVNYIYNYSKKTGRYAGLDWMDNPIKPTEFALDVDSRLGEITTLKVLAHEAVHIKQFALGELRDYVRGVPGPSRKRKWKGEIYNLISDDIYWDLPWEIEAHGREEGLVSRFLKFYDKKK